VGVGIIIGWGVSTLGLDVGGIEPLINAQLEVLRKFKHCLIDMGKEDDKY